VRELPALLDRLEEAGGPTRSRAVGRRLGARAGRERGLVGRWPAPLAGTGRPAARGRAGPEQILAAPLAMLVRVVADARPAERAERLRRCAELAIAGVPWRAYPERRASPGPVL